MAAVVLIVAVLVLAATGKRDPPPPRCDDRHLRRDTEDIAIYGAVVRPPLEDD